MSRSSKVILSFRFPAHINILDLVLSNEEYKFRNFDSFQPHFGPGVDSASNRNEYQEPFRGQRAAGV
jgi:hypothetical protein